MLKFLLVVFIAVCCGIGAGLTQNWVESRSVEDHFVVYQRLITSESDNQPVAGNFESSEANIPTANVQGTTVHNFGSLEKGETGSHTFVFKNTGTGPLTITLTNTSCKCTMSDLRNKERTIAPGDQYPVTLTFKSDNWAKKFRQSATIETNDPARRIINLYVEGVILQPIRPEPAKIVFSNTTPSQESEARIKLYGYKWKDVVVEKLEFLDEGSREYFTADVEPLTEEDLKSEINSQCGYQITIKTKKDFRWGPCGRHSRSQRTKKYWIFPSLAE